MSQQTYFTGADAHTIVDLVDSCLLDIILIVVNNNYVKLLLVLLFYLFSDLKCPTELTRGNSLCL